MLQQRQLNDIYALYEVSQTPAQSPGAVGAATTVVVNTVSCTIAGTTVPATFALGDSLEVVAPASAVLNGVEVRATVSAAGVCSLIFYNPTAGSITPVASSVYKIIAKRFRPDLF